MSQPDWIVEMIDSLSPDLKEEWDHRSAHMTYDANLPVDHAEVLSLLWLIRKYGLGFDVATKRVTYLNRSTESAHEQR